MNKMRNMLHSITLAFALCVSSFSQIHHDNTDTESFGSSLEETDQAPITNYSVHETLQQQKPESRFEMLGYFSKKLENAYTQLPHAELPSLHLYKKAMASIQATQPLLKDNSTSFRSVSAFDICSVLTEAALIQIKSETYLYNAQSLNQITDSLQLALYNVQSTINGLERSYISVLEEKLDYTQQTLNEEREAARKMMEEAQSRFSELQSEIISVSEDARGTIISMSDILFDVGKASLTADLQTSLARIAGILLIYRDVNVIIEGHTDNVGSNDFNMRLSEQRAQNVMNFLSEQGIAAERLSATGYGFHRPVADNSTNQGRAKNRRVDLVIQDTRL